MNLRDRREPTSVRREEREIKDQAGIESVIQDSQVCRMGLCDDGKPYVVPMNFGYRDGKVYMHCATEGRKLDVIRKNPRVCLEFDADLRVKYAQEACNFTMNYKSVIAWGRAQVLKGTEEKIYGMNVIMGHYTGKEYEFPAQALARIVVIRVDIEEMTGKQNG